MEQIQETLKSAVEKLFGVEVEPLVTVAPDTPSMA